MAGKKKMRPGGRVCVRRVWKMQMEHKRVALNPRGLRVNKCVNNVFPVSTIPDRTVRDFFLALWQKNGYTDTHI